MFPHLLLMLVVKMRKLELRYRWSPMVKTQGWWITRAFLPLTIRYDFGRAPKLWSMMLVLLAVLWSVSLSRMNRGHAGLVQARQLVRPTKSGWDGIQVRRIACYALVVVKSGVELVSGEGDVMPLLK